MYTAYLYVASSTLPSQQSHVCCVKPVWLLSMQAVREDVHDYSQALVCSKVTVLCASAGTASSDVRRLDVAGPYFYLPKMQSHKEARLWNDVFVEAQDLLNIPRGTIKVPCLHSQPPALSLPLLPSLFHTSALPFNAMLSHLKVVVADRNSSEQQNSVLLTIGCIVLTCGKVGSDGSASCK